MSCWVLNLQQTREAWFCCSQQFESCQHARQRLRKCPRGMAQCHLFDDTQYNFFARFWRFLRDKSSFPQYLSLLHNSDHIRVHQSQRSRAGDPEVETQWHLARSVVLVLLGHIQSRIDHQWHRGRQQCDEHQQQSHQLLFELEDAPTVFRQHREHRLHCVPAVQQPACSLFYQIESD